MQIAIIDDDRALCRSLQIHLERTGHRADTFHTGEAGLARLSAEHYDVLFLDLDLPDTTGLAILRELQDRPGAPLTIMITGIQDARSTIEAIRLGAFDYIRKPLDLDVVLLAAEKASRQLRLDGGRGAAPIASGAKSEPDEIVGSHPAIIEVLKQIALVAESNVPVLIQGETGTGKELVARALHDTGRQEAPFVAINCSALVPTLLESELFGHVKGAFTGADSDKAGKMEVAGGGTLFFDEIGDMSVDLQAKLLRVLQEKEFERIGDTKPIPFRARVVAATHRDLKAMAAEGTFREDLYYRLAVSTIAVPALRDRRSDIPALADRMLARITRELHKTVTGIETEAVRHCTNYDWPGNVRELSNVLTRAVLLCRRPVITEDLIAASMGRAAPAPVLAADFKPLREAEKEYVYKALVAMDWNIQRTAALLDISRVTLRKKIEDYGLVKPPA